MSHERGKHERGRSAATDQSDARPAPGKRTLIQAYGGAIARPAEGSVQQTAARGAEGTGGRLPHFDVIQRAFGHHDISGVRAHTGGAAAEATRGLGAEAYTQGSSVVLGEGASLRTVAHEAAHAVQQRSGLSIAGGVGSAGDAHEKHADAVADRVTAGQSAASLLDGYGAASSAAPSAGPVQFELRRGEDAAASAAIVRQVAAGDNVFQMRALLRALSQAAAHRGAAAPETEHIACVGGGDSYDLQIARTELDELEQLLDRSIQRIETAATGGSPDGSADTSGSDEFSTAFNARFENILAGLRSAGVRTCGGLASSADAPMSSSTPMGPFSAGELRLLVTASQRAALQQFFVSPHTVPDRLFTAEHGGFSAQQRILISGHILATGTYSPGSFAQRMHARMCGHWVEMVNAYAGCSADGGAGVETNFDHAGNIVLSSGRIETEYRGDASELPEAERTGHRLTIQEGLPVAEYEARIQTGDWLYLFTNTDTRGGNHSVVFVRWAGDIVDHGDVTYRRAIIMGQSSPDRGGTEAEWSLGSDFRVVDGNQVYPVTMVMRHPTDATVPETVDDVVHHELGLAEGSEEARTDRDGHTIGIPELGSGPGAAGNTTTIAAAERRLHGRVSLDRLRLQIRERNAARIAELATLSPQTRTPTMTEDQRLLFTATNDRDDIETLVRLNERLVGFVDGATALVASEATDRERIDAPHEARADELEARMDDVEADVGELEEAMEAESELADLDRLLRRARRSISGARSRVTSLTRTVARDRNAAARARHQAALDTASEHLAELETTLADLEARQATAAAAEAPLRHALEDEARSDEHRMRFPERLNSLQRYNWMVARMRTLTREITAIEADGGYHMAQRVGGDDFRGRTDGARERTTGQLSHVQEAIDWSGVVDVGETGLAEEARGRDRATAAAARPRRGGGGGGGTHR